MGWQKLPLTKKYTQKKNKIKLKKTDKMKKNNNFIRIALVSRDNVILNVNYIVQVVALDNNTCEITLIIGNGNIEFLKVGHPFGYMMNLLGC